MIEVDGVLYVREGSCECSPEVCDGVDNDCDDLVDEGFDADTDGYTTCEGDCNDTSAAINPGVTEMCEMPCVDSNCLDDEESVCQAEHGFGPQCDGVWRWCGWGTTGCCASGGNCYPSSPIIIDVSGNGFELTNAAGGVDFDLNADGVTERLSWTAVGTDDSWLTLDRNGNGMVDNGTELFGNYTSQPRPTIVETNGFAALGVFDTVASGGNADGEITKDDAIFDSLRLWRDSNQNGFSEPSELKTLSEVELKSIDLDFKVSRKTDEHGNQFKYRAKVKDKHGAQLGRWAWDVFLVREEPSLQVMGPAVTNVLFSPPLFRTAAKGSCGLQL